MGGALGKQEEKREDYPLGLVFLYETLFNKFY